MPKDFWSINMFRKSRTAGEEQLLGENDEWLVLGHFDTLNVQRLTSTREYPLRDIILKDVTQNAGKAIDSTDDFYCHSIYLIPPEGKAKVHRDFWEKNKKPVMFITRIHLKPDSGGTLVEGGLEEEIDQLLSGFPQGDYIYGKTLELSDLILITRSNSAGTLLEKMEKISLFPSVGDVYSYCCLARRLFFQQELQDGADVDNKDKIALVSMRFSMRNAKSAIYQAHQWHDGLKDLKDSTDLYFVTGTEDINIIFSNISTGDLVRFFKENIIGKDKTVWSAFDDMTTRLGIILCEEKKPDAQNDIRTPLQKSYAALQKRLKRFVVEQNAQDWDWIPSLCHIVNTLTSSSADCVLDQLCYILFDGLNGLMEKLETHKETLDRHRLEIYTIVNGIVYLEEHIIRMEGQLLRRPETRPLVFNMPAAILELNLMVMHHFSDYFQSDDEIPCNFHFLLVPILCRTITVRDLLYEKGDGSHLLYVEIPLAACYKPSFVACTLAHEIAHFGGDATRLRSERSNAMFLSTAFLMSQFLGVDRRSSCILCLIEKLLALGKESGGHTDYMDELTQMLKKACRMLIQDREFVYNLQSKSLQSDSLAEGAALQLSEILHVYEDALKTGYIQLILDSIEEIGMLAKECYADIAMIELLDLPAGDYIDIVWTCYCDNNKYEDEPLQKALLIERAAIVLLVAYRLELEQDPSLASWIRSPEDRSELRLWLRSYCLHYRRDRDQAKVCEETGLIYNKEDATSYFHPFEVIDCLCGYLRKCLEKMRDLSQSYAPKRKKIQEIYQQISKEYFLSQGTPQALLEYRENLLSLHGKGRSGR